MSDAHDVELVHRARRGDIAAVGELYDRHQEAIFRFCWSRIGHQQIAEDLTGEIFARMVDALPSFREEGVPFRAWLYRIARNLLTDTYRRHGRRETVPLEAIANTAAAPRDSELEMVAEMTLTLEKVQDALEELDPRQRAVVELRFLGGLSLKETAASLNESVASVKTLQHRGLKALRIALPQE